jgi:endonuclease/exonuclease/phosphatase family metal-dependent hydrolase
MKAEYEKGNYVIAGGDFNQTFPDVDTEKFPIIDTKNFVPTQISKDYLPDGWSFVTDYDKPTSRLLNEVYSGNYDNTQLYIIDGYIISPNIECKSVETIENNFSYSDHQPVKIKIKLK